MADAKLGIIVDADVSKANSGLSILQHQLERLQKIASLPGLSFAQLERLNSMLLKTQGQINTFNRAASLTNPALSKFTSTTSQSTIALSNLSRVAQDAPYGFIGIANNLNPLLESFQRLKVSTGSTGGALSALGKSLTGAGGVGLALGIASSLAVVFGDSLFGVSKAAKEAEEANKKLAEDISGDIVKLTSLVAIIRNNNASNEDRAKALKAVNQEYSKYLPALEQEKVTLGNISTAYDKVIDSLIRQAVVKGLQEEIEKSVSETAASLIAFEKAEIKKAQATKLANDLEKTRISATDAAIKGLERYRQTVTDGTNALIGQRNEQKLGIATLNDADNIRERITNNLKKSLEPLFGLMENFKFDDLGITLDKAKVDQTEKEMDKLIAKAKRLLSEFGEGDIRLTILPTFSELDTKQEAIAKAKKIISDVNDFFANTFSKDRVLNLFIPISAKIKEGDVEFPQDSKGSKTLDIDISEAERFSAILGEKYQEFFNNNPIKVDFSIEAALKKEKQSIKIGEIFGIKQDDKDNPLSSIQKQAVFAAQSIRDVLQPAFANLFESIKAGESPLKAFFQGLGQAVGQLIQKLIQAAITAAVLSAIFPGGFGGVQGFGKIFGNLLGFAEGGRPPVGVPSLVGERGPELFIPDTAGRIVSNNLLGNMRSLQPAVASSSGGSLMTELSGDTLRLWIERANKKGNRGFGR